MLVPREQIRVRSLSPLKKEIKKKLQCVHRERERTMEGAAYSKVLLRRTSLTCLLHCYTCSFALSFVASPFFFLRILFSF